MPITNASKLADFASGASSTNTSVIQVDYTNQRVGIGTTNPQTALNVVGVVSATSFYGSGANLTGVVTAIQAIVGSAVTINSTGVNVVGVVTATSFVGNGSGLTGLIIPPSFNELDGTLFS